MAGGVLGFNLAKLLHRETVNGSGVRGEYSPVFVYMLRRIFKSVQTSRGHFYTTRCGNRACPFDPPFQTISVPVQLLRAKFGYI